MSTIAEIEKQVAERARADRQRLARARAKADEELGARLRDLVAPNAPRAEQVERAGQWLAEQAAKVTESRQEEPRDDWAEGDLAERSEAV